MFFFIPHFFSIAGLYGLAHFDPSDTSFWTAGTKVNRSKAFHHLVDLITAMGVKWRC